MTDIPQKFEDTQIYKNIMTGFSYNLSKMMNENPQIYRLETSDKNTTVFQWIESTLELVANHEKVMTALRAAYHRGEL